MIFLTNIFFPGLVFFLSIVFFLGLAFSSSASSSRHRESRIGNLKSGRELGSRHLGSKVKHRALGNAFG